MNPDENMSALKAWEQVKKAEEKTAKARMAWQKAKSLEALAVEAWAAELQRAAQMDWRETDMIKKFVSKINNLP